ncbi:MAG: FtsX-like permease family protein [Bacteroidales bacterium]
MLALKFALRYLFSKKSHSAINIISFICVCGVALTSMALITTMSVFNGFQDLVSSLYSNFDPQVKIKSAKGKTFHAHDSLFLELKKNKDIDIYTEVLEENALFSHKDRQVAAKLKGVAQNFEQLTNIDSVLVSGEFVLSDSVANYTSVGIGLATQLGINTGFIRPITVYAPMRGIKVNLSNPSNAFKEDWLFISSVFSINQPQYDDQMLITSLDFARNLFQYNDEVTAIELKLKENIDTDKFISALKSQLGPDFLILNRYEQQADSFRMMQIEKWVTFLIMSFILLIAAFNIIGSLSMLIIEKQSDMLTLRNLGAGKELICRIFLLEGWLISGFGAVCGILIGVFICLIQQHFGLLTLGNSGMFIVDAYPVKLEFVDVIAVLFIVTVVGFITAWIPVRQLRKKI